MTKDAPTGIGGDPAATTRCAACGLPFACGVAAGGSDCWCKALPALATPPDPATGCLCPACLRAALAASGSERAGSTG